MQTYILKCFVFCLGHLVFIKITATPVQMLIKIVYTIISYLLKCFHHYIGGIIVNFFSNYVLFFQKPFLCASHIISLILSHLSNLLLFILLIGINYFYIQCLNFHQELRSNYFPLYIFR